MKYLHLNCLKEWIRSKCRITENDDCKTYVWDNLFWELCHAKYPDYVKRKKKKVKVIEFDIPEEDDYVCLESFQKREDK